MIGRPAAKKLSPAHIATKDADGVLKGSDAAGRPIIAIPPARVQATQRSRAVISVIEGAPEAWSPIARLKLSYHRGDRPRDALLAELRLKLIEDYDKGSFMIVEPLEGQISGSLAKRLEECEKVRYVTPVLRVRVVQTQAPSAPSD
jgi:hypothetical protein